MTPKTQLSLAVIGPNERSPRRSKPDPLLSRSCTPALLSGLGHIRDAVGSLAHELSLSIYLNVSFQDHSPDSSQVPPIFVTKGHNEVRFRVRVEGVNVRCFVVCS